MHHTIDPDANEAVGLQLGHLPAVLAFTLTHNRCHDHQLGSLRQLHDLINHLFNGLGTDGMAATVTQNLPDPGIEQTQVVIDFGDRADRRTRIFRGCLLFDGNGRG